MSTDPLDELGPIDVVVIGFPPGAPMTGEAAPLLVNLVNRGIIRVFDVLFVTKGEDGQVAGFTIDGMDQDAIGDFTVFAGASSRPAGRRGRLGGRRGDGAGRVGGRHRLREHLGRAVRGRRPSQRRAAHLDPAHPRPGADRALDRLED